VERICDSTVSLLGDGSLAALPGGVEEYLLRRATQRQRAQPAAQSRQAGRDRLEEDAAVVAARTPPVPSQAELRSARKELLRLEREIARYEKREAALHELLTEHAADYPRVSALNNELREVLAGKDAAEERWLELSAELE
jgi:ATP-binding cassette subfamily F protein uup